MEILGIGAPELVFVIIIALIILGPKDMQKAGRTIGRWLNQLVQSDGWKAFQQTSREIRNLPTNLMRQANTELAETEKEIRKATDFRVPTTSSSSRVPPPLKGTENSIKSESAAAQPPKTQSDVKPDTVAGSGNGVRENSIAPSPDDSPEAPAEPGPTPVDTPGNNQAENSTASAPPSVELSGSQSTVEPGSQGDDEKKPDVNTTNQNA